MIKSHSYIFLFLAVMPFMLWSCGGSKVADGAMDSMVLTDSLPDSAWDVPEEDTVPPLLELPDTESQLTYMRTSGNWDKYREGILPQMAEDAPEYCEKILQAEGKRFIVVDKAKMKLFLYTPYGEVDKSYGIACAKNYGTKHKKGDSRTTEGIFKVKGVFDSTEWLFTDDNGYTSPKKGQYGPRFIRLNIPYIGIHGTGSPGSIGRRCSHGCIRVTNPNILELVKYVEEGMPVIISPGPRDMAVNESEGTKVLSVATEPGSSRARPGRWVEPKAEEPKQEDLPVVDPETTEPSGISSGEPTAPTETAAPEPKEEVAAPAPVETEHIESE